MRISDWSSDVGSSDLIDAGEQGPVVRGAHGGKGGPREIAGRRYQGLVTGGAMDRVQFHGAWKIDRNFDHIERIDPQRSEEHTSELQSLMRISYAVFCLKKKK